MIHDGGCRDAANLDSKLSPVSTRDARGAAFLWSSRLFTTRLASSVPKGHACWFPILLEHWSALGHELVMMAKEARFAKVSNIS